MFKYLTRVFYSKINNRTAINSLIKCFVSALSISFIVHTSSAQTQVERPDFEKYFRDYNVTGSFVLYDLKNNKFLRYNPARCATRYSPASTFKIFNALAGLETGVITDQNFVIKWDGKDRLNSAWNKDQDLKTAFRNSTVWYFQEVARLVRKKRMKKFIKAENYGNMDIHGGIDKFWLSGELRISQDEQIEFLKKMYKGELSSFSKRSVDIVRKIIFIQDTLGYKLSGKTGTAMQDSLSVFWFTGFLENDSNTYFFCTNFETYKYNPDFFNARLAITDSILKNLGIIPVPKPVVVEKKITIDEMVGQMLIIGIYDTVIVPESELMKSLAETKVGGVLLFEKNIGKVDPINKLRQLVCDLKQNCDSTIFVSIDYEGGRVARLKTKYGFPRTVTASYLGRVNNLDSTKFYGDTMAATLADLGINLNFAPVVDLCSNKDNPIIAKHERCFSDNPAIVTRQAIGFIKSLHNRGICTVLKHFPGHGSSTSDSHTGMVNITDYWKYNELDPYKDIIDSGFCDAVMTAHILNYCLDPDSLPATLSKRIVTGILRDSLHFDGVIFSDDMQMHAISKYYGLEKSLKLAINAGVDMLIFSHNINDSRNPSLTEIVETIKKLVANGDVSQERIEESYRRILTLKSKFRPKV